MIRSKADLQIEAEAHRESVMRDCLDCCGECETQEDCFGRNDSHLDDPRHEPYVNLKRGK